MYLFFLPEVEERLNRLSTEESWHCVKVLRLTEEDIIHLTDGKGNLYECAIRKADHKGCIVETMRSVPQPPERPYRLHIGIAPTKSMDRLEWFMEKATEIGIEEITPVFCAHSERIRLKPERLLKILVSAMKQSLKSRLPKLNDSLSFAAFLKKESAGARFIGYCETGNEELLSKMYQKGQDCTILIGPEGDFSTEEIEEAKIAGYIPISLGNARLRTETAGVVACTSIAVLNE
jgi:16S rRNA (uracil1498-N3)-methyltransferase